MGIYETVINNLEKLRDNYGLDYNDVDRLSKLKSGTYHDLLQGNKTIDLKELISITKVYLIDISKVFNPKMRMPSFNNLPQAVQEIASERLGKTGKIIEKKDLIYYCVLIFHKHYKIGSNFTNSDVKNHLTDDLQVAFKGKSIEWDKSILSNYITFTQTTQQGKTKPEKIYKLIKEIPMDILEKAKIKVGTSWLGDHIGIA